MRRRAWRTRWRRRFTTCRPNGRSAPSSTTLNTKKCTGARLPIPTASGRNRQSACIGTGPRPESRILRSIALTFPSNGTRTARSMPPQLHRPPSADARQPDRDHLGRRRSEGLASTSPIEELHEQVCRFANVLKSQGVKQGRPRHHLSADDPRSRLRHARLRAHRRGSFGGVRRLLAGLPRRPHRGLRNRTSSSPPTKACAAASKVPLKANTDAALTTRSGGVDRVIVVRRTGARGRYAARPRRLVPRGRANGDGRMPARGNERGGSAVHSLHLRLDRKAQGRAAHDRRLSGVCRDHAPIRVRLSRRRHLLVHRRCRLGDRPQLYRLRPAGQRRHDADVRGRAELSRPPRASGR